MCWCSKATRVAANDHFLVVGAGSRALELPRRGAGTETLRDIWTASGAGDEAYIRRRISELGFFETRYRLLNAKNAEGFTPIFLAAGAGTSLWSLCY